MIDVLLKATKDAELSELDLQQMVAEMFIGAVVPGAMPITWAILVLINNPQIQARLHAELAYASRSGSPGIETLERLPYFQAFASELLRLYGASPLIPRRSVEATDIAGYRIPADSEILVNYYGLHTDPAVWPDPFAFRPERFLEGDSGAAANWTRNYMPFGKGGRNCPGKPLAEYELQIFLSRLVLNFEFSPPDHADRVPMEETIGLALCPVHSRVRLAARANLGAPSSTTAAESPHAADSSVG
jgi:cytochrome P450